MGYQGNSGCYFFGFMQKILKSFIWLIYILCASLQPTLPKKLLKDSAISFVSSMRFPSTFNIDGLTSDFFLPTNSSFKTSQIFLWAVFTFYEWHHGNIAFLIRL